MDVDPKDKTTQAQVLVGRFLWHFAILESTINTCMGKVLGIEDYQTYIVGKNTQFRDKINILKTAAALAAPSSKLPGLLDEAADIAKDRNMVAHEMFAVSDDETGVQFYAVRARGRLSFPEIIWTPAYFQEKYVRIERVWLQIEQETESGMLIARLAEAVRTQPRNALREPDLASNPYLRFLESQNSQIANPQTDGGTPKVAPPSEDAPKS